MTTIPGFLTKTYEIFNTPEYTDCCGWGNNGSTIVIKKIEQFSKSVLPKYFKHSNFQSFVRQLNMYDFRKTVQDPNHGEFQHPNFRQDRPELLPNIKRKAHHKSSESNKKSLGGLHSDGDFSGINTSLSAASLSAAASLGSMGTSNHNYSETSSSGSAAMRLPHNQFKDDTSGNESDILPVDSSRQQGIRDEFEVRLQNIEAESARVTGENVVLKQLVLDSRQKQAVMQDKMDKVLKTLYNMFMGGGNSNNLSIQNTGGITTNTNMVPLPPRSSLAPQMLESLIFRLDSLQTYGLRMNADIANAPGGIDIGSVFGEEDTLPLSTIAADMTQLVTSCRNGKNNYTEYPDGFDASLCSVSPNGHENINSRSNNNNNNNNNGTESSQYDSSFNNPPVSAIQAQSISMRGQPISQMQSFDTMASRVSAPNLIRLEEMSVNKADGPIVELPDSPTVNNTNTNSSSNRDRDSNHDTVFGGGSLSRQRSIYPGQGSADYPGTGSGSGMTSSLSMLSSTPLDRQDSENFSWSSLFSMSSIDGYGLMNASTDNNYPLETPGTNGVNAINTINNIGERKIKEEVTAEDKHFKRGIAELGSTDGTQYNPDKNSENRENAFRRQKLSSSYPPLNPHNAATNTNNSTNNNNTNSANTLISLNSLGSINSSSSSAGSHQIQNHRSMDPPSSMYSSPLVTDDQYVKTEAPDNFYGHSQRHQEATALTRIDSLELTIATLLKSMDSFDANNNAGS